jgi:hypothetical protein
MAGRQGLPVDWRGAETRGEDDSSVPNEGLAALTLRVEPDHHVPHQRAFRRFG